MNPLARRLHDVWFEPAPATRLALLRILIGGFAFGYLMFEHDGYLDVARTDPRLFAPVGVVLHGPVSLPLFEWLLNGTLLAGLAFTLGVWHRLTGPLFAGSLLWILCYRNSWSMIYHSDNLVALHVIVLGLTRSADALSLDSLFRDRRMNADGRPAAGLEGWEYNWPVKLICAVTLGAYFVTAVAKLSSELGFAWMTGQNLRAQMAVDGIRKELLGADPNPLAYALYDSLPLFSLLAVGSLCVEFFAPAALFNRRLGRWWAIAAFGFHWGILMVMNIKFHYQLWGVMFLPFFNIERILDLPRKLSGRWVAEPSAPPAPALGQASQPGVLNRTGSLP